MLSFSKGKTAPARLPRRVLVVEDHAEHGRVLEEALIQEGVDEVNICPSTACSLERLRSGSFDAIILDVHLADSDMGWEIAELVDAVGGDATRIIFQTDDPTEIPPAIQKLGPVLTKPYGPDDLIAMLKTAPRLGLFDRLRRKS